MSSMVVTSKLTEGQKAVLVAAARASGVTKGSMPGRFWRNFDQLERRGLISLRNWGVYVATNRGYKLATSESAL